MTDIMVEARPRRSAPDLASQTQHAADGMGVVRQNRLLVGEAGAAPSYEYISQSSVEFETRQFIEFGTSEIGGCMRFLGLIMIAGLLGLSKEVVAKSAMCSARPLKVAMYEEGLLYSRGTGIDRDLLNELGKRTGCQFTVMVLPRARAYLWLKTGEVDVVMSSLANDERRGYAWFLPYLRQKWMAILATDVPGGSKSAFYSNTGLHFGVVRGTYQGDLYQQWEIQLAEIGRLQVVSDPSSLYDMLRYRRISGFFAVRLQFERELRARGMERDTQIVDWFPSDKQTIGCIALSKKTFDEDDLSHWARALAVIKRDGTLLGILTRYVSKAEAKRSIAR